MRQRLRVRLACWLMGHDDMMVVETRPRRMALRCLTCGRETAGWHVF